METMEQKCQNNVEKKEGGFVTMPFIFANEICEKLAVVGFSTNMISYLTSQLHLPLTKAANTLTNFGGTAAMTPLIGAFLADSFAGRFWTITIASIIYQLGMISLTTSAVVPKLRPPPCSNNSNNNNNKTNFCQEADSGQLAILYVSLLLTALGSGGILSFGADQFDENDPKQKTSTWKFFNWYYFCMGASILVANTVIVYVQDNIGWGWGLGIPTVAMGISVIAFVFGYPLYRKLDPAGSPFTRLAQVCVAAYKKRKVAMLSDPKLLYDNDQLDAAISLGGKLLHTKSIKFLDKAAIVTPGDDPKSPDPWALSTVHRVEELKSVLRMGPIWAAGILLITAYAQQNTFSLQQAKTMDRHLTPTFQIPPASMSVFTYTSMLATILLYDRIFAPESMRSTAPALFWLSISAGNYTSTLLVTLVHRFSEWLPDRNLNRGKLEYLYWLITLLQFFNFIYYLICAKYYTFKPVQARGSQGDEEVELSGRG
ncbi:Protein NRT1/ PTR FAMILY 3.1 [Striga hermonthica]|uniref:Protein NRT1/ PTR FAMILY 3.1 n=1 Tax=Striga hermonthica TaxID=68872 RepID=A0A9N7MKC5_STRHE|nr:Protein NRT1/ PTR FAMILY 3.1 [Striga hermonthica]